MGCCKKKKVKTEKAASSLAPTDKYHRNPQGSNHHHHRPTNGSEGGELTTTSNNSRAGSGTTNNNNQFSHNNGITPSRGTGASSNLHHSQEDDGEYEEHHQQQQYLIHHPQEQQQLIQSGSSPYHFYPSGSIGSGSSSLLLHQQPPYLVYRGSQSSSSGNGSHIIEGSNNGSAVEGSGNKYYYYYNGYYYPATVVEEGGEYDQGGIGEEQIFTITATTTKGKQLSMGRVGEDVYHPPGSPASITGIGANGSARNGSSGLFKSKSGSIPSSGSPLARGFRDTFVSSMSPSHHHPHQHPHALSAENSPLHRSSSATTANNSPNPDKFSSSANNNVSGGGKQEGNKKWTFGGLFRRNKTKSSSGAHSATTVANTSGVTATSSNNNSILVENGLGAHKLNNNNYGNGSPLIVRPVRTYGSPARPASFVGFVNTDPNSSLGHIEINRYSTSIPSSTPKFVNAEVQTRAKGKLSESDISTCDSDFELALENPHDNPPEPAPQENPSGKQANGGGSSGGSGYKQNFLVRRLSRRKEKAAAKKKAALAAQTQAQPNQGASLASGSNHPHHNSNGFISSSSQQHHGHLDVPQMKQRVGSSPDSLNNSSEPWPSWETTKKPQTTPLHALQHQHHRLLQQNYSSNGSLSLSQEGGYNSNNNSINSSTNQVGKSGKAAAKEAVKARAIARRESFLRDSSSSDDDEEDQRSQSSLQGSFSSLNSRNRRQRAFAMQQAQFQQQRHLFPAASGGAGGGGGISCASPSSPMPVPLDYRNSVSATASPNMNRRLMMMGPPGSPKWDIRPIYHHHQQEGVALSENGGGSNTNQPVAVRLPRKLVEKSGPASNPGQMSQNNGDQQQSFIMATEMISEDQHVVTAGLKVPFLPVPNQDQQSMLRNGQLMYPDDPVQYANVANGMRGQSSASYANNVVGSGSASSSYNNAMHHASPTPPPPPPPRRAVGPNNTATNPNFYRPVSCSYLDSYATQLHQMSEQQHHAPHPMRQQSPMIFNGNYIHPQQTTPQHQYQGQSQEVVMNGGIARSSPRRFAPSSGNNNQADVDSYRHPPLIRSPSEPPITRAEQARSSASPVKRLLSSPMSNSENNSDGGKNVITSKLGFPVRRLQEASKLTGPQGPVHLRASEFWRKKESEVATSPSPVGSGASSSQKKYLSRIRSADSSPLPVPKMRKSPAGVVASNESISSLSSFSENAGSPGPPKNCSSPINPAAGILKHGQSQKGTSLRAHLSKTPNPQQLTYGNNNSKDKENNNSPQHQQKQQSAVERLKVRVPSAPDGIKSPSSSTNPPYSSTPTKRESGGVVGGSGSANKTESNNSPIRSLIELNNGKTPGKNLEDALNELEDMYKSLRLSDEDLLDRAERRDLPTAHQELRDAPLIPIPQAYHRFEHLGSVESLGTGSGSSGTNYTGASFSGGEAQPQPRVRAPPTRRSCRPDTVSDDMANRRLAYPDGKPLDPRLVVAKTGSYLARSPAFSPCTSPCPPDGNPFHQQQQYPYPLASVLLGQEEPDLTLDDVTFRNYKRANAIRIIDPQPPFGIPLGPITAAPANDYLHSKPSESYRPIFGHLKTPDVVNDDIAFRNLRKDLGQDASLANCKDWTPRLFSPNRETSFNYPKVKDNKKLRAIRSLSANITHMIPPYSIGSSSSHPTASRGSPTSPFHHQQQQHHYQAFKDNIGKWSSSYSDLNRRASSYMQPSWVEQIEKVQTSTETLTDHRNSSLFQTAILDPPEHWERKFPKKTVELTPPIYDPEKARRPWTDIILESFEKEKQKELERLAAEEEAAAAAAADENATSDANNKTGTKTELEGDGDDDVFMDASDEASKSEAVPGIAQLGQSSCSSGGAIKISGNGSKNNDPESFQQTTPNKDTVDVTDAGEQIPQLARPLPLLQGQKTRRGSWVEPSRSYSSTTAFHASQCVPATAPVVLPSHSSPSPFCEDKRRKSWSDLPKDIDSFSAVGSNPGPIIQSGSSCSASPTKKLFNPLPPPKKIRQINLEAFNNNNNTGNNSSAAALSSSEKEPVNSNSSSSNDSNKFGNNSQVTPTTDKASRWLTASAKNQGEDELNALMDQLLRDADSCSQSVTDRGGDKEKSISPGAGGVSINTQRGEMKMDGKTSSSGQSGKQDLSCTIVGIIPKQPSPPREAEVEPDRNNQKVEQQKPTFSQQNQVKMSSSTRSNTSISPAERDSAAVGSRQASKIDNGKESGGVPKDKGSRSALPTLISDPIPIFEGRTTTTEAPAASSIEDLIDSINESLPELEASCGVPTADSNTHSSEGKQSGSSSSSIPSPSPGSPIPPILSVSVKKEASPDDDITGPAAFPVPAKRHHLPPKYDEEESLYENLPTMASMMRQGGMKTGNDEKVPSSSSSPFSCNELGKSYIDPFSEQTSGNFVTINREGSREAHHRRAPHPDEDDQEGDNEEEETQHSTTSSHQPSSLSSNDSSEVCGVGGASPRGTDGGRKEQEHLHQQSDPSNIRDSCNRKNQVDQTCPTSSSSSLACSLPTSTATTTTTTTTSSSDTFTNKSNNNATEETRNSSTSSSRESLLRKKSEAGTSSRSTSTASKEDKKMMKQSRSTRRESRSNRSSHSHSGITRRSSSSVCIPARKTTTATMGREEGLSAILLDFPESRERIKTILKENGHKKDDHQTGGFSQAGEVSEESIGRSRADDAIMTKTVLSTSLPSIVPANSCIPDETCSFVQFSPGESRQSLLGGFLSKKARRARMFQLSNPTMAGEDEEGEPVENAKYSYQQQRKHISQEKDEKWRKMIEIMEKSPIASLPKCVSALGSASSLNDQNNNGESQIMEGLIRDDTSTSNEEEINGPTLNSLSHLNERDNYIRKAKSSSNFPIKETSQGRQPSQAQSRISKADGKGKQESVGYVNRVMTRLSSSSVEETSHTKQNEQRPVAQPASFRTPQQQRKSPGSTAMAGATETSALETGPGNGMSFLRNNFPFFRNSTSRSRSQSVISDVSRSSETGESKKEKDKSYRRKSHLNRAFTDEPVPDNDYAVDITPKSSKPTSHEASSLESSAVEESRSGLSKPNVKIHPAIPPVLTCNNNKSDSNLCKSINRNSQHFESTPSSPLLCSKNASLGKVQTGEQQTRKGSPVVKKDSFSDAEGVSFIKKMLQKESDRDRAAAAASSGGNGRQSSQAASSTGNSAFNIKKSPSAGNQSYWSKFSSSQSAFLRKLFEKPKATEAPAGLAKSSSSKSTCQPCCSSTTANNNLNDSQSGDENSGEKDSSEKENAEPVLGFSVAQKASFFMKLEHDQRFSKWRKNSVDLGDISGSSNTKMAEHLRGYGNSNGLVVTNNTAEFRPRSSRHFTQPLTPTEFQDIPLGNATDLLMNVENHRERNPTEFGSQPALYWNNNAGSNVNENSIPDNPSENPSIATKSFYKEYDDTHQFEPNVASNFKDRDGKFDEIVTGKLEPISGFTKVPPTSTVKSYSLTRSNLNTSHSQVLNNLGGFPMYHSASAIIPTTNAPLLNSKSSAASNFYKGPGAAYSSSSSSFSEAVSSTKFLSMSKNHHHDTSGNGRGNDPPIYENDKRRGSASDLEMSRPANQSPLLPRAEQVKSMFISRSGYCDPENLSEDGEFSSGGQEVAEIICRSYENSPVFRKKNWRAPKHTQANNFTKEIWRRCGNYESWNQRSSTNPPQQGKVQPQHPIPQTFTATTNVIEVSTAPLPPTSLSTVAASPPPTTSNLLQILTVLSSSNDELNESKPKAKKHHRQQVGGSHIKQSLPTGSNSIPPSVHKSVDQSRRSSSAAANSYRSNCPGAGNNNQISTMPQAPLPESSEIFVSVPHPEDEAFQSFFCSVKSYTQVTHYPSGAIGTSCMNDDCSEQLQQFDNSSEAAMPNAICNGIEQMPSGGAVSQSDEAIDISSVRREGDLLVMKRNVPPAKRKSTNGKYKNPLRALAARMDFRQQGYTQQSHTNSNNSVHCNSSDVDVTT